MNDDIADRLDKLVIMDEVGSNNPLGREAAALVRRLTGGKQTDRLDPSR